MYPELRAAGQTMEHLYFQRLLMTAVLWILYQGLIQQRLLKLLQPQLLIFSLHDMHCSVTHVNE